LMAAPSCRLSFIDRKTARLVPFEAVLPMLDRYFLNSSKNDASTSNV
jgi:hypothetical protein